VRLSPQEVEAIFRESGALRDGHFVLASGKHSPQYLEKFAVLQWPARTERLCGGIAEALAPLGVETVAGPTTGGVIIAHEVARQLGVRAVYAERTEGGSGRAFRRGIALRPGERVAVVDDVLSTGGSILETADAARAAGAEVVATAVLADRSGGSWRAGEVPHVALWTLSLPSYDPAECPQCAAGIAATKPGTTPAPATRS
jgi:orotate phosphoribosyltransferase